MKNLKLIAIIVFCLISSAAIAHTIDYGNVVLRKWQFQNGEKQLDGSFYSMKGGVVYIEDEKGSLHNYKLNLLSLDDQKFALSKERKVEELNQIIPIVNDGSENIAEMYLIKFLLSLLMFAFFTLLVYKKAKKEIVKYFIPAFMIGCLLFLYGFTVKVLPVISSITDPLSIDSAFMPFKPKVNTFWDANYFYVESKGIPDHQMMTGITNWQQQVPIPQCYIGSNAWSIPLNPVIATTPVPVSPQHFLRGAIAIATNGVPIFNPYTNTGVDAYLDGQLDNFGGHCGRGDDYHYHTAPLFLYGQIAPTLPIAFALDGFAVYGSVEPDGSPIIPLDANHGHYGSNGVYHYHGTSSAPYMIGNMVGRVTEDSTLQIVPQAHANPIRPGQNPLQGAVITNCQSNGNNNGYVLSYSLNSQTYSIDYNWTTNGVYSFNFISPSGSTFQSYNGFAQCMVPTAINEIKEENILFSTYPNPVQNILSISYFSINYFDGHSEISICDIQGKLKYQNTVLVKQIDMSEFSKGIYLIKVQRYGNVQVKKIVVQ